MIKVLIKKNKDDIPYYFKVSGHAGYANFGNDIVCSAVSVLMITIANSIELNTKDDTDINVDEKNTCIVIDLHTIKENKASAELIVLAKTLYLGIIQVKEEYEHKYISVKEENDND